MSSTRVNSTTQNIRCVCTALAVLLLCISAFPKIAVATASTSQSNSHFTNQLLLHTDVKSYELLPSDFASLVGNDSTSFDTLEPVKPYEAVNTDSHPNYSKVSDFVYLDREQFDSSLFSPDDSLRYTTDDAAVDAYIQTHPELAGVTDRRILLPVFEFDSDNDIQTHRDRVNSYIANGQLAQGSVGQDNTAVIDTSLPMGQYKLEKTLSYDQEHGFYYIYTMHVGVSNIDRNLTTFVDSNGNKTEKQGLFQAPEVVGNDILDHKEVDSYTISAGYDGDGNVARPTTYVTHITYYYTLAHTAYVSDTGTTLKPIDAGLQNAPATISSYNYDHTVDAGTRRVLDIDAVTARLMAEIQSQDITQLFPVSAATHNGDIVISRTPGYDTYDIQLFENGQFTIDMTYMPDGTPRVVDADGNAIYFSNHFKDVVYSSYQDDTLPVGQYRIEYLLTPTSADPDNFDSYQHLKVNLVIGTSDTSQPAITANWTHIYVKQPETTPETPETHTPEEPQQAQKKSQLPDTADYSQIALQGTLVCSSVSLVSLSFFLKKKLLEK